MMKAKKLLIALLMVAAVLGAILYGITQHQRHCLICFSLPTLSPEVIRHYIEGFGPWAIVIYIILYMANTFSPFVPPILIMSLSAGAIFGPIGGTIALTLGTLSGTTAAFFAARYLGRSWVEGHIKGKGSKYYDQLSRNGFFILLPMRLIGFPPYGIIDFICGLSKIKYRDFFSATIIGAAPWIITQVLLADRFTKFNPKDPVLWGLLILFISMIVITGKIVKKKQASEMQTAQ